MSKTQKRLTRRGRLVLCVCLLLCLLTGAVLAWRQHGNAMAPGAQPPERSGLLIEDETVITERIFLTMLQECLPEEEARRLDAIPAGEAILDRQNLYRLAYEAIRAADFWGASCIPVSAELEVGTGSGYFQSLFQGKEYTEEASAEARLLKLQKEEAGKMSVYTEHYGDGTRRRTFIWGSAGDPLSVYSDLSRFHDYTKIQAACTEGIRFAWKAGFIPKERDMNWYAPALKPDQPVSVQEISELLSRMENPQLRQPLFCLPLSYYQGDPFDYGDDDAVRETYLFLQPEFGSAAANLLHEHLDAAQLLEEMYLDFDDSGTRMALWFQTNGLGLLCLPADWDIGQPFILELSPHDPTSAALRTALCTALIPSGSQNMFRQWVAALPAEQEAYCVSVSNETGLSAAAVIRDENVYAIYMSLYEREESV